MPIWETSPVNEVPEIHLRSWQIFEVTKHGETTRHFAGYNITEREGRVSSAIVHFDPQTRTGVTLSGRVYQLVGSSGTNMDAAYTWNRWCDIQKLSDDQIKRVTDNVVQDV